MLLLNEGGVLVDRTADFATLSDVAGDSGFLTPTNDRDILVVDVDQDGWLDVVTATAQSGADPKHVAYPRVYRNLGRGEAGWLGLRHEDARIPALLSDTGVPGFRPNFAALAAGDVNADGYPDLYFADYDVAGGEPAGADFNDKLLLNQGAQGPGYFVDATADAFDGTVGGAVGLPFPVSGFGISAAIADMNGDAADDILKVTAITNGRLGLGARAGLRRRAAAPGSGRAAVARAVHGSPGGPGGQRRRAHRFPPALGRRHAGRPAAHR